MKDWGSVTRAHVSCVCEWEWVRGVCEFALTGDTQTGEAMSVLIATQLKIDTSTSSRKVRFLFFFFVRVYMNKQKKTCVLGSDPVNTNYLWYCRISLFPVPP